MDQKSQSNPQDFDSQYAIGQLKKSNEYYQEHNDFPIEPLCCFLQEFCKIFKQMSRLLGIAFSDIIEKIDILRQRDLDYPNNKGIFDVIEKEKTRGVLELNGDNNKSYTQDKKLYNYISLARTVLRIVRFYDYLNIMFSQIVENKEMKISEACSKAYNTALYPYHTFLVQTAAKAAMMAAPDRKKILNIFIGLSKVLNEEYSYSEMQSFLKEINPIRLKIFAYFSDNKLNSLP